MNAGGPGRVIQVITIDGPAGSGKSSTAREVARRLRLRHLDSGALYRALTLGVLRLGVPEDRWDELGPELAAVDVRIEPRETGFDVLLDGRPAEVALRSPEVTRLVPRLARLIPVRQRLLSLQRSAVASGGIVADGRDMGTVVFPDAALKVFLTASLEERARRRLRQEGRDPGAVRDEAERIRMRDASDEDRPIAPLRRPDGALVLDTTDLAFEEQVSRIVEAASGFSFLRLPDPLG